MHQRIVLLVRPSIDSDKLPSEERKIILITERPKESMEGVDGPSVKLVRRLKPRELRKLSLF